MEIVQDRWALAHLPDAAQDFAAASANPAISVLGVVDSIAAVIAVSDLAAEGMAVDGGIISG